MPPFLFLGKICEQNRAFSQKNCFFSREIFYKLLTLAFRMWYNNIRKSGIMRFLQKKNTERIPAPVFLLCKVRTDGDHKNGFLICK